MGAQGVWRIIEGKAVVPVMYNLVGGVYVESDGKTPVAEDQIEACNKKVEEYEKRKNLAEHIILSSVSPHLGSIIKNLKLVSDMWDKVKSECLDKSMIHIIDAESQFTSMHCPDSSDAIAHRSKSKHLIGYCPKNPAQKSKTFQPHLTNKPI
jgi:hypothetical protein